jgi:nicotinamidase/pyrazinamidase
LNSSKKSKSVGISPKSYRQTVARPLAAATPVDSVRPDYDSTVELPRYGAGTALVVVDVQNDFADPGGSLYVRDGEAIVPRVNAEIRRALEAGSPVLYTQDWHPPVTAHFRKDGGIWPVHCVHGTWGAEFHPALDVVAEAPIVRKGTGGEDGYSAFSVRDPHSGHVSRTQLGELLDERGVKDVVIAGLATDYCVKETGLDALELGYHPSVLLAAVRAVDLEPGDGGRALVALAAAGADLIED